MAIPRIAGVAALILLKTAVLVGCGAGFVGGLVSAAIWMGATR